MRCLFVTWFSNLSIPRTSGRGFEFAPGCYLTSDPHLAERILVPGFASLAGRLAVDELQASRAVFYSEREVDRPLSPEEITSSLEAFLGSANLVSMAMWFVKDNGVRSSEGYYQLLAGPPRPGTFVTRHSLGTYYWDALASNDAARFELEELASAREYLHSLPKRLGLPDGLVSTAPSLPPNIPRLGRAWYLLENARMTADLATRVANYVTCLESLFATATQELSHTLSERVAYFLAQSPEERRVLYEATKTAYSIRSKVLHGDELSKKDREILGAIVVSCDSLVRRALLAVLGAEELIATFNGKKDGLNEFFIKLALGAAS